MSSNALNPRTEGDRSDATTQRKVIPFIVDVPANMLKRNTKLSRGARMLYMTMRALANGRTGELAIRGNPLDWKYICRQAEISRATWHKQIRELVSAGYVHWKRERVTIWKGGRRRVVLGRARYVVHKQPKTSKSPEILLRDNSCAVQKVSPQISSETPSSAGLRSDSFALRVLGPAGGKASQSSSPAKLDDSSRAPSLKKKKEEKTILSFKQ